MCLCDISTFASQTDSVVLHKIKEFPSSVCLDDQLMKAGFIVQIIISVNCAVIFQRGAASILMTAATCLEESLNSFS